MALVDTKKAAEILGISNRTLERWRLEGNGPEYLKIGAYRVNYDTDTLEAFMNACRRKSTSDQPQH